MIHTLAPAGRATTLRARPPPLTHRAHDDRSPVVCEVSADEHAPAARRRQHELGEDDAGAGVTRRIAGTGSTGGLVAGAILIVPEVPRGRRLVPTQFERLQNNRSDLS